MSKTNTQKPKRVDNIALIVSNSLSNILAFKSFHLTKPMPNANADSSCIAKSHNMMLTSDGNKENIRKQLHH
jgi:hypothetical protein